MLFVWRLSLIPYCIMSVSLVCYVYKNESFISNRCFSRVSVKYSTASWSHIPPVPPF